MVDLIPRASFSISALRWAVLPEELPPAFKLPRLFLASARNSLTDFAGTLGWSDRTSGVEEIQLTGCRSFWTSNFMRFAYRVAMTEMLPEVKRMVLPSGGDSTAIWVAIRPEAPVRLSIRKFCPMLF